MRIFLSRDLQGLRVTLGIRRPRSLDVKSTVPKIAFTNQGVLCGPNK